MPFYIVQNLFYKGHSEIDYVFSGLVFFVLLVVICTAYYSPCMYRFLKILFLIMHVYVVCICVYESVWVYACDCSTSGGQKSPSDLLEFLLDVVLRTELLQEQSSARAVCILAAEPSLHLLFSAFIEDRWGDLWS